MKMNIAFEISPLLLASGTFGDKSGVYRYYYGLIKSYGEYLKKTGSNNKIVLFSFNRDLIGYPLTRDIFTLLDNDLYSIINAIPPNKNGNYLFNTVFQTFIKPFFKIINKLMPLKKLYDFLINDFYFKKYLEFLKKELKKNKVKIIYHSETSFYPLKEFINIITVYDLTPIMQPYFHREATKDLMQRKLNFTTRYCQGIITISEATKKDLFLYYPKNINKKITVCYPGLDPIFDKYNYQLENFEDLQLLAKKQVSDLKKNRYILYYGTFEPRKNLNNLVEAFAELHKEKKIPEDFKLILMGGDGWGKVKKGVINFIKENFPNPNKNSIIVFDFLNDQYLISLIKNAYAFIYPSFYEGFGLPVLESMSFGIPVISSSTSSLPEVTGKNALFINPYSFWDIKQKIKYLINHPKAAVSYGKAGLIQSKKFKWEKSAAVLHGFLKKL